MPQISSVILAHCRRPAKSWKDSGNRVSRAGQSHASTALSMAIPCSCLTVPCTNRLGNNEDSSKQNFLPGQELALRPWPERLLWEAVVCPV